MVIAKKKKPKFSPLNLGFFKSVKARWRRPRGTHNKKRMKFKWTGKMPNIGYKNASAVRGLHPKGHVEKLVRNMADLLSLESVKNTLVRVSANLGAKKRKEIEAKAKSMNLKVVNSKF
jgi:large subunit ribosomal protein L32e